MVELQHPSLNPPFKTRDKRKRANKVKNIMLLQGECRCYLCGRQLSVETITLDHVVPKSQGGRCDVNNLRLCCRRCNKYRAVMPVTYWRMLRGFVSVNNKLELKCYTKRDGHTRLKSIIRDAWSKI